MAGSINKVILVGRIGKDPEVKTFNSGDKVCNFSLATEESWKDKQSGERRSRTEWHNISITNQGLVKVAENYLKKGSKIYIEGQLQTRSWDSDGGKKYITEVVLKPYGGELVMLDGKKDNGGENPYQEQNKYNDPHPTRSSEDMDETIPF